MRRILCWMFLVGAGCAMAQAPADTSRTLDPERARERVAAAREAAGRERHEEAARTYLEALASDARLVPMVADELAYQKLWREDAAKAVFYFRRYLARHPGQPNREVRQGLALAYSWSNRLPEAIALYRELVAEDPTDAASRLGLGRALIWDNRLHEGARVLDALEADDSARTSARDGARDFLLTVLDSYDPTAELRWTGIWDSDDLTIHRLDATGRSHLGRVLVEATAGHAWYDQPGRAGVTAPRLKLGAVTTLAPTWQLHAYGWVDRFKSDGPLTGDQDLDWTAWGADAWLTWLATNRLRVDLGAGRQSVESLDALAGELQQDILSLSADWRLGRALTLSGILMQGDFTDDNRRRRATVRLGWRREGRLELRIGPAMVYMDHEIPYPGGYWAPDWVRKAAMEASATYRADRLVLRLSGSFGREKELGADAIDVGAVSGHAGWRWHRRWLVSADASHSRSRFASASGYRRTVVSVALRGLF